MAKFFTLLSVLALAFLTLSQAKILPAVGDSNSLSNDDVDDNNSNDVVIEAILGDDVDEMDDDELDDLVENLVEAAEDVVDNISDELDDFPLDDLDDEGLEELGKAEDEIFVGQLDVHIAKQLYLQNNALTSVGTKQQYGRRKRALPLLAARAAWTIGRTLFSKFARSGVTRSGSRITQHYGGRGNYGSALRDFERMRPTDVSSFTGKISGRTGRVGNYRVTVRDGSSKGQSRPTLSVNREGSKDFVRKFRYNGN